MTKQQRYREQVKVRSALSRVHDKLGCIQRAGIPLGRKTANLARLVIHELIPYIEAAGLDPLALATVDASSALFTESETKYRRWKESDKRKARARRASAPRSRRSKEEVRAEWSGAPPQTPVDIG